MLENTGTAIGKITVVPLRAGSRGLSVKVNPSRRDTLAAGGSAVFSLAVAANEDSLTGRTVNVLVRYKRGGVSGVVTAMLKIEPSANADPAKVATLSVDASLGDIRSGRTEPVYLAVTNKTGQQLDIGPITTDLPSFLSVGTTKPFAVPPFDTATTTVEVKADDQVRPGKHQIVFSVPAIIVGTQKTFTLITAQEASVSVEGESALVTAFGVPAIALLPGGLILAALALLWQLKVFRHPDESLTAPTTDVSKVLLVGVSAMLSFGMVGLWRLVFHVDFFAFYGLTDIFKMLGGAMLVGLLGSLALLALRLYWLNRRIPAADDTPIDTLKKLGRRHARVIRDRYTINGTRLYDIDADRPGNRRWVAPAIRISFGDPDHTTIERDLAELIDNGETRKLGRTLRKAEKKGAVKLSWVGSQTGPSAVEPTALTTASPDTLVRLG